MINENEIDWNVFTQEERVRLQGLLDERRFGDLNAVVHLDLPAESKYLVYAKVEQLERMKKIYQPVETEKISHAHEEFEKWLRENPKGIENKEQEKYWNDKFKEERKGWAKKDKPVVVQEQSAPADTPTTTDAPAVAEVSPEKPKKRGRRKKQDNPQ